MECSLLLIKQHRIDFSWFAAHKHYKSTDYKTSTTSELDQKILDRVNRVLNVATMQLCAIDHIV